MLYTSKSRIKVQKIEICAKMISVCAYVSLLAGGRRCFYHEKLPVQLLPPPSLISGRANLGRRQNGGRWGKGTGLFLFLPAPLPFTSPHFVSSPGSRGQKSKMAAAIAGLGVFHDKNTVYRRNAKPVEELLGVRSPLLGVCIWY